MFKEDKIELLFASAELQLSTRTSWQYTKDSACSFLYSEHVSAVVTMHPILPY